MEELKLLNQEQELAVTTSAKYARIIAGAGSGKTRVLTTRISYLISHLNVLPSSIYAITFTNKAANEMKERVKLILGNQISVHISTFHSLALRILRENIDTIGFSNKFVVLDVDDQVKIIKEILKQKEIEGVNASEIQSYISNCKSANQTPEDRIKTSYYYYEKRNAELFGYYQEYLYKRDYLDFDDLLTKAIEVLSSNQQVRQKWQNRISHLLVDEFQDTNESQYELIKLLLNNDSNLFVVGDPDQTIYTWRGARFQILLNFQKDFKNTKTIILNQNYRSTQEILDCSNNLISKNKERIEKDLFTNNDKGTPIKVYSTNSLKSESNWVTDQISELINQGVKPKDIAILYRSNYISRDFEATLISGSIPYRIYGGIRFFERQEIKDAISYLRICASEKDDIAFLRIFNSPRRGIGIKTLDAIMEQADINNISYLEASRLYGEDICSSNKARQGLRDIFRSVDLSRAGLKQGLAISEVLNILLVESQYMAFLNLMKENERIENLQELKRYLDDYVENNPNSSLDDILQEIALYTSQDEVDQSKDYISMMTVHTSKGLEFDYVFLVGFSENVFPSKKAIEDGKIEEERRLAYVGMTRARKRLFISTNTAFNYVSMAVNIPSRFIKEAGLHAVNSFSFSQIPGTPAENVTWQVGDQLFHNFYGKGEVIDNSIPNLIRVKFEDRQVGEKTILEKHNAIRRIKKNEGFN